MKNTVTKCTQGYNNKIKRGTNTRTIIAEIKEDYAQIAQRKHAAASAINTWQRKIQDPSNAKKTSTSRKTVHQECTQYGKLKSEKCPGKRLYT